MGEQVRQGALHDRWRIRRHGKLIFADDLRIDGAVSDNWRNRRSGRMFGSGDSAPMSGKIPVARSMQYARRLALTVLRMGWQIGGSALRGMDWHCAAGWDRC
jgi:hypothetical protein